LNTSNKLKIFNDPIYGFITIPNTLISDLIAHPYFQRLRRISQMGLSYVVYPGAHHTRFHHALGCLHLMQKAVRILRFKGVSISSDEENALYIAILLHDIGHGPFSHAMEHSIVHNIDHESISLRFMEQLNDEFDRQLSLAITIFKGEYPRHFFGQLISSQLDMDRSDYLKRDSFYTGVSEGNINSERLISMMNVVDDKLVIEKKGIFSIEKFLTARRLMYWQVYLHKTSLVAEQMIINVLKRAKSLAHQSVDLNVSPSFEFFLKETIDASNFDKDVLNQFSKLDDYDIVAALKSWQDHSDTVLSALSVRLLERKLFKIKFYKKDQIQEELNKLKNKWQKSKNSLKDDTSYFVFSGTIKNTGYKPHEDGISILHKDGSISDIIDASDNLNLKGLCKTVKRHYICFPKEML
jgi:HD superfamily phosphohydrolase